MTLAFLALLGAPYIYIYDISSLRVNCDHDHTGILAHTPAPHQAGPLPQPAKTLVTGTPSDAAAHASYPPRIRFLHQTVTE